MAVKWPKTLIYMKNIEAAKNASYSAKTKRLIGEGAQTPAMHSTGF